LFSYDLNLISDQKRDTHLEYKITKKNLYEKNLISTFEYFIFKKIVFKCKLEGKFLTKLILGDNTTCKSH